MTDKNKGFLLRTKLWPSPISPTGFKGIYDISIITKKLGYRKVNITLTPMLFFLDYIKLLNIKYLFIVQPGFIGSYKKIHFFLSKLELLIFSFLTWKKKLFILVLDLPIEQGLAFLKKKNVDYFWLEIEKNLYHRSDKIITTFPIWEIIQKRYNLPQNKFSNLEMLDYLSNKINKTRLEYKDVIKIVFIPSYLSERNMNHIINKLPYNKKIKYYIYGNNGEWIKYLKRDDISYMGYVNPNKLVSELHENYHYGLILYDVENMYDKDYVKIISTYKFSAYMASEIPVISPTKYSHINDLINKYQVGFTIDEIEDISTWLNNKISKKQYLNYKKNIETIGKKVRSGDYLKEAIMQACDY